MSASRVRVADLVIDPRLQMRPTDSETITAYADAMREGEDFPPISVCKVSDGETDTLYVTDGVHRALACKDAGIDKAAIVVFNGSFEDAVRAACAANASHGLRRTAEDRRRCIRAFLDIKPDATQREIAEAVRCSRREVARYMADAKADKTVRVGTMVPSDPPSRGQEAGSEPRKETDEWPDDGFGEFEGEATPEVRQARVDPKPDPLGLTPDARSKRDVLIAAHGRLYAVLADIESSLSAEGVPCKGAIERARDAASEIRGHAPESTCPTCAGRGCFGCRDTGYLTITDIKTAKGLAS